jgi:hypothetical protein
VTTYEPTASEEIGAYMTAAEWLYAGQPMQPSFYDVEETQPGVFRIPAEARNADGRFLPARAVCAYDDEAQEWVVKFPDDQIVKLRDVDGELSVVTE